MSRRQRGIATIFLKKRLGWQLMIVSWPVR